MTTTPTLTETDHFLLLLRHGPTHLQAALKVLAERRLEQARNTRDLKRLRMVIAAGVAGMKGEDGKPKYSNETAREAAIQAALEESLEATYLQKRLDELESEISDASIEVEYVQAQLSAARAAAVLLAYGKEV